MPKIKSIKEFRRIGWVYLEGPNIPSSNSRVLPNLSFYIQLSNNSESKTYNFAKPSLHSNFGQVSNNNDPLDKLANESTAIEEPINTSISPVTKDKSNIEVLPDSLHSTWNKFIWEFYPFCISSLLLRLQNVRFPYVWPLD